MKLKLLSFYVSLKSLISNRFAGKKKEPDLAAEIERLRDQINSLYSLIKEQSNIIVAVTRVQSDLADSISKIENRAPEEDCFLIKIPIRDDGIAN